MVRPSYCSSRSSLVSTSSWNEAWRFTLCASINSSMTYPGMGCRRSGLLVRSRLMTLDLTRLRRTVGDVGVAMVFKNLRVYMLFLSSRWSGTLTNTVGASTRTQRESIPTEPPLYHNFTIESSGYAGFLKMSVLILF